MKKVLIIYPHWHPANLAGVHRPRLIGNYLADFGWNPRVLTVEASCFEEQPDPDFERTFSPSFHVTRVKAYGITRPRLVGDIGIRAFRQLYQAAIKIIREESIDFVWIPIPSFYMALLGRLIYEKSGKPYGIDYIDPWVRNITNQRNWRAKASQWFARLLEPVAVRKAALISGVSTPYYAPVIERNFPKIANQLLSSSVPQINPFTHSPITHVGMPYGFDPNDHTIKLENLTYPWQTTQNSKLKTLNSKIWLYAGAFLPNSHVLMDAFFKSIARLRKLQLWDESIQLWFIGTGPYPAKRITAYANDHGVDDIVFEHRERFPFLQVLNFLSAADTVMVIGSTEEHYTASKTFQSVLSGRPVVGIFHYKSSAIQVMADCAADAFTVRYHPEMQQEDIVQAFEAVIVKRLEDAPWQPNLTALEQYSSRESARKLVEVMEKVVGGVII